MAKLTIPTKHGRWVVPEHFEIIKAMIEQRQLRAADLRFASPDECQRFTKRLALMALADECAHHTPSIIAALSQRLVQLNTPTATASINAPITVPTSAH